MTAYNTYQEAKIAKSKYEVAVVTRVDEHTPGLGRFISVMKNLASRSGYSFLDKGKERYPNINDGYYTICNPADYCMTVEKFLKDNCKFDDGDTYLDWKGRVRIVGKVGFSKDACNDIRNIVNADQAFILRAAALEGIKPTSFGAIPEKPRTKVEYVKCEFSHAWEAVKAFEDGEVFHAHFMTDGWVIVEHVQQVIPNLQVEKLYRRIETPMAEREAFIDGLSDWAEDSGLNVSAEVWDSLFDSGLVKLVN